MSNYFWPIRLVWCLAFGDVSSSNQLHVDSNLAARERSLELISVLSLPEINFLPRCRDHFVPLMLHRIAPLPPLPKRPSLP